MKKQHTHRIYWTVGFLFLAAIACNAPAASPTSDLGNIVGQTQTSIAINQVLTPQIATPLVTTTTAAPQVSPQSTESPLPPTNIPQTPPTAVPPALPSATLPSQPENCINKAKFESETIPDNTQFSPEQEFMKTWTLRNIGTCTWSPEYVLVFQNGDQMGGTSPVPIGQKVSPNGTIQLYLPQKAPRDPGEYQGFWKLRSTSGKVFGLGDDGEVAFWVKINVIPGASQPGGSVGGPQNLGTPTWVEGFDDQGTRWYLGSDEDISFDIEDGKLVMTAFKPIGDQWRVAEPGYLDDFYLQAKFIHGPVCSGKDGYGFIVRAPDQADGNIDSGFVFSFSCDGKYRIYRMDNGNFSGIVNWTSASILKMGPNQANTMGIWAKGEKLQLYANGALLYEFIDSAYPGGLFGLSIRSEFTSNLKIFVDEVAYWSLD